MENLELNKNKQLDIQEIDFEKKQTKGMDFEFNNIHKDFFKNHEYKKIKFKFNNVGLHSYSSASDDLELLNNIAKEIESFEIPFLDTMSKEKVFEYGTYNCLQIQLKYDIGNYEKIWDLLASNLKEDKALIDLHKFQIKVFKKLEKYISKKYNLKKDFH